MLMYVHTYMQDTDRGELGECRDMGSPSPPRLDHQWDPRERLPWTTEPLPAHPRIAARQATLIRVRATIARHTILLDKSKDPLGRLSEFSST